MSYEPKTLHHPHFRKGKIQEIKGQDPVSGRAFTDYQGESDQFPPITVKDQHGEAYYRSRGYLAHDEAPAPPAEYAEYPVMLAHPDHVEAIADDFTIEKASNGEVTRHRIPGSPEKFPPMVANSQEDEAALGKKGYHRAGKDDPDAIRTAKAVPYKPGQKAEEYPKMVAGEIVEDPATQIGGPQQYPKWVLNQIVNSRAEEERLTGSKVDAVIDECIICGEVILESEAKGTGKGGSYHLSHASVSRETPKQRTAVAPKAPLRAKPAKKKPVQSRRAARAAEEKKSSRQSEPKAPEAG